MYNFASDYLEGAHPQVMEALNKTNFIQTVGYGEDQYDYDFFSIKRLSSCYCC